METPIRTWSIVALLACLAFTAGSAQASNGAEVLPKVVFDHQNGELLTPPSLRLRDGQVFTVIIENTLPELFIYEVAGIELNPDAPGGTESRGKLLPPKRKTLFIRHEAKYAGYIVRIKPRPGEDTQGLSEVELVISVDTQQWDLDFAGAFTASELSDPVYSLQTRNEGDEEATFIVRDREAEDDFKLGIGAFVHLFHTRRPWAALTFGLGINEDNKTTYFIGPSWRWGDKGALTAGVALGSIARLPAGAQENAPTTDTNVLGQLGTRTVPRFFVGFSYAFISDIRSRFEKPFAGEGAQAATGMSRPQTTPTPPVVPDPPNPGAGGNEPAGGTEPAEPDSPDEQEEVRPPTAAPGGGAHAGQR